MSGPIPHRQRIALRALTSILFVGVMLHLLIKPPLITTYDSIGSDTNSDISRKISTSSNKKQECYPHPQPQYQILMCLPTLEDATTTLNNNKNENYNDCQPHVIFTTFVCSDKPCSPLRKLIERNTYHIWSSFPRATFLSISASSVRTNIYGIPVLGDMFHYSMTKCPNATSFTYINGDLLATTSFIDTIDSIVNIMGNGEFLMVGQRTNVDWKNTSSYVATSINFNFTTHLQSGELFYPMAMDYFTTTKNAIEWNVIPPFVIGRAGFDQWLMHDTYWHGFDRSVALVDATNTAPVIHQTDEGGVFAHGRRGGSNKNADVGAMEQDEEEDNNQFNLNLARRHKQMYLSNSCCLFGKGKTTNAQWETFLEDGKIGIRHRDEHPFILFESYKELSFLPV